MKTPPTVLIDLVCQSLTQLHWFAIEKWIKLRQLMQPMVAVKQDPQKTTQKPTYKEGRGPKETLRLINMVHMVTLIFIKSVKRQINPETTYK